MSSDTALKTKYNLWNELYGLLDDSDSAQLTLVVAACEFDLDNIVLNTYCTTHTLPSNKKILPPIQELDETN
jgi:hypothetical protein